MILLMLLFVLGAVIVKAQAFHLEMNGVKATVTSKLERLNNVNVYWVEWLEGGPAAMSVPVFKIYTDESPGYTMTHLSYAYSKVEEKNMNGKLIFTFDRGTPDERIIETSSKTLAAIIRVAYGLRQL